MSKYDHFVSSRDSDFVSLMKFLKKNRKSDFGEGWICAIFLKIMIWL